MRYSYTLGSMRYRFEDLKALPGTAGANFIMGVPGADDVMLNYQSTSFHDANHVRELLGLRGAPEFED